jgi:hypothetical protein
MVQQPVFTCGQKEKTVQIAVFEECCSYNAHVLENQSEFFRRDAIQLVACASLLL